MAAQRMLGNPNAMRVADRLQRVVWLVLLAGISVSCDGASPLAPSSTEITNITWRLRSLERTDQTKIEIQNPERFTFRLEDTGRVSVRADCNSCSGSYSLVDDEFRAGVLACTRAYCGSQSLDTEYLAALRSARLSVSRDGMLRVDAANAVLMFGR